MKKMSVSPQIVYEDNHLLALNKPNGMLVHADITGDRTLEEWGKSYEVMKKTEPSDEEGFSTEVRKLVIDNSRVYYNDGKTLQFKLSITSGEFKGGLENEKLDLDIDMNSTIDSLKMDDYVQKAPFPSVFTGQYTFEFT